jgi:hypothetical protein
MHGFDRNKWLFMRKISFLVGGLVADSTGIQSVLSKN